MSAFENLVLNPVEFTPELPEIDLSAAGIAIGPGAPDYGESTVAVERIRQAIGEGVTNAHWPSVEASVPLIVSSDPAVSMAEAFKPIEGFVAEVQRRNRGWIRREFAEAAGFSGSVGCYVDAAALTTPKGRGRVDEITLKLSRYPIWFATVEIEGEEIKASAVRSLEFEIAELLGTAPGLINLQIKNEGEEDWRGCVVSLECDDYSSAETAKAEFEAKELTLQGGSELKTVSGAEVVKCPALTKGWVTALSSEIEGIGHMTHIGPRRMLLRLNDVSTALEDVQWKLEWRSLGAAQWVQTMSSSTPIVVSSPVVGDYQVIDLGECRPEQAITGEQRWEWRLQARSLSGSGKQPLIRDVYPMSTEQWARVADSSPDPASGAPAKAPGKAEDKSGTGTVAWEIPGELGGYAEAKLLQSAGETTSHYLKATQFGFALPESAIILGIIASIERRVGSTGGTGVSDHSVKLVKAGTVSGTDHAASGEWTNTDVVVDYGSASDLWGLTWTQAQINESGFGVAISAESSSTRHARIDAITLTVYYAESANTETHVCFASRSMQFTDTGPRRQHITDEVWGDLSAIGVNLVAPAPGQSGQSARALIIPSVGDFDTRADSASVKLAATANYRPGYLFAREAV